MKRVLILILSVLFLCVLSCALFSCKESGEEGKEEKKVEEDITEEEHVFSYVITEEPTEYSIGEAVVVCSHCDLRNEIFLPVLSSEDYTVTEEPATCTEDGKRIYTADFGIFTVTIDALGHDYAEDIKEPTCTEEGYEKYTCSRCGNIVERTLSVRPHTYTVTETEEGDCTHYGYKVYTCSVCGDNYKRTNDEYTHDFGEGEHVNVSCDAEENLGYTLYTCSLCGEHKKVYDEKPDHHYNKDTGKCEVCGENCKHDLDGYVCKICGLDVEERVKEDGYFHLDANGNGEADVGEKVYAGFYPKSVASKTLTARLKTVAPDEKGYYVTEEGRYVRSTLDQREKSRVKFSNGEYVASYADYSGESTNYDYYFYKIEPISWTIKEKVGENVVLRSDCVLDVIEFLDKDDMETVNGDRYAVKDGERTEKRANCWETSGLREYLNGEFFQSVFAENVKERIVIHETDNGKDTSYYKNFSYSDNDNTLDKVFIESYSELFDTETETFNTPSSARMAEWTDYALGRGIDAVNAHAPYYTRSVGNGDAKIGVIDTEGKFDGSYNVYTQKDNGQTIKGVGFVALVEFAFPME